MSILHPIWRISVLGACLLVLAPYSQAGLFKNNGREESRPREQTGVWKQHKSSGSYDNRNSKRSDDQPKSKTSKHGYDKTPAADNTKSDKREYKYKKSQPSRGQTKRDRDTSYRNHERDGRRESSGMRDKQKRSSGSPASKKSHVWSDRERTARQKDYWKRHPYDSRPSRSHERYYNNYSLKLRTKKHHHKHETYHYHTHYLAPIRHHYHPIGFHVHYLPRTYISIFIGGIPYYYYSGVFYRNYVGGYVVVRAPIGAVVNILPVGFISFYVGGLTYYYVNDTYYVWDDELEGYVVVNKPHGADKAMSEATAGRLYVYPKQGQSEEQQASDRYECHRWAVHQTDVDPSLAEPGEISSSDQREYKRAITACLEGRGYSVK